MKQRLLFIIFVLLVLFMWFNRTETGSYRPGIVASNMPVQQDLDVQEQVKKDDYVLTKLAKFDIEARVLAREDYSYGRESDLSPVDLALGWGRMSDVSVLSKISISQSGRFYYWRTDNFPIPRQEIETHSANMHMIPANDEVADLLDDVRQGDVVQLSGSLVKAAASDGWIWRSSLTRNDTGAGACELILVDRVTIAKR